MRHISLCAGAFTHTRFPHMPWKWCVLRVVASDRQQSLHSHSHSQSFHSHIHCFSWRHFGMICKGTLDWLENHVWSDCDRYTLGSSDGEAFWDWWFSSQFNVTRPISECLPIKWTEYVSVTCWPIGKVQVFLLLAYKYIYVHIYMYI